MSEYDAWMQNWLSQNGHTGGGASVSNNPFLDDEEDEADKWTGIGPSGYGTYYLDGPGGSPGTYIGDTRAPKEPSSGGGGAAKDVVTIEIDPATGRRYRAVNGVWASWMDPAGATQQTGPDPDGDGYDNDTGLPVGVTKFAGSPTGLVYQGKPVNPDGSLYDPSQLPPDPSNYKYFTDPVTGAYSVFDPLTGTVKAISNAKSGPGSGGSSSGSFGYGATGLSGNSARVAINPYSGFSGLAAPQADPMTDYQSGQLAHSSASLAEQKRQFDLSEARRAAEYASSFGLNRAQAEMAQRQQQAQLAKDYAEAAGMADPLYFAARLHGLGGGNIANMLEHGDAISDRSLYGAAGILGQLRNPVSIPGLTGGMPMQGLGSPVPGGSPPAAGAPGTTTSPVPGAAPTVGRTGDRDEQPGYVAPGAQPEQGPWLDPNSNWFGKEAAYKSFAQQVQRDANAGIMQQAGWDFDKQMAAANPNYGKPGYSLVQYSDGSWGVEQTATQDASGQWKYLPNADPSAASIDAGSQINSPVGGLGAVGLGYSTKGVKVGQIDPYDALGQPRGDMGGYFQTIDPMQPGYRAPGSTGEIPLAEPINRELPPPTISGHPAVKSYNQGGRFRGMGIVGDQASGRPTGHEELVIAPQGADIIPLSRFRPEQRDRLMRGLPRHYSGTSRYSYSSRTGDRDEMAQPIQPVATPQPQPWQQPAQPVQPAPISQPGPVTGYVPTTPIGADPGPQPQPIDPATGQAPIQQPNPGVFDPLYSTKVMGETPEDRAMMDEIRKLRQSTPLGSFLDDPNALYHTNFFSADPVEREIYLRGLQASKGVPIGSAIAQAEKFRFRGLGGVQVAV